jgi:hypothetical protein
MKRVLGFLSLAVWLAPGLVAQGDVGAQFARRLPADVAAAVATVVDSATARGLPTGPLVNKALEGAAKGVPGDRIVAAVRMVLDQMNTAAVALRGVGETSAEAITAGAFAISAGLSADQVTEVARTARPNSPTATALQVVGTLAALGVPPASSVDLVDATIRARRPVGDLISLPSQVQAAMARGAAPAAAAAGLARSAEAHAAPRPPNKGKGQDNPHKP